MCTLCGIRLRSLADLCKALVHLSQGPFECQLGLEVILLEPASLVLKMILLGLPALKAMTPQHPHLQEDSASEAAVRVHAFSNLPRKPA